MDTAISMNLQNPTALETYKEFHHKLISAVNYTHIY